MKRRRLTPGGLLEAMTEYATQKDLGQTPELYADTLLKLTVDGYGYSIVDRGKFDTLLRKVCRDPRSGFKLGKNETNSRRVATFYKVDSAPKERTRHPSSGDS